MQVNVCAAQLPENAFRITSGLQKRCQRMLGGRPTDVADSGEVVSKEMDLGHADGESYAQHSGWRGAQQIQQAFSSGCNTSEQQSHI